MLHLFTVPKGASYSFVLALKMRFGFAECQGGNISVTGFIKEVGVGHG